MAVGKTPEHEAIYHRIRDRILFGDVVPGQAITIEGLKRDVDAGMTPVREAIRRLCAEGALEALENRRVCVPCLTPAQLDEIYFARLAIEPKMALMAAERADKKLADTLEKIDDAVGIAIDQGDIKAYLKQNYHFHFLLYQQADAAILEKIALSLWLRVGPSLRVVCGRFGTSNLPDRHVSTIEALRKRQTQDVQHAIEADIRQGMDLLRESMGLAMGKADPK